MDTQHNSTIDQQFIEQEIKALEGAHADAIRETQGWANRALQLEGALTQMRKLQQIVVPADDQKGPRVVAS